MPGELTHDGRVDLEALRVIQEVHDKKIADEEVATAEVEAKIKRSTDAEPLSANRDALIAEARRVNELREDLSLDIEPTAVEKLEEARTEANNKLQGLESDVFALGQQLGKVADLAKGAKEVAPEIEQAIETLEKQIEATKIQIKEVQEQNKALDEEYGEITEKLDQIGLAESQVGKIDTQVSELMDNTDVAELVYEQADAENKIRDRFQTETIGRLRVFRFSSGKQRSEQGNVLIGEMTQELLGQEIERLGVNEFQNPQERAKRIDEIRYSLSQGIENSINNQPGDQWWRKAEDGVSEEKSELMFRGYLFSQLADSAQNSPENFTANIENWSMKHGGKEKQQELLADFMPKINKLRAASYVDQYQPLVSGTTRGTEREEATNMYFPKNYFKEVYDQFGQNTFRRGLEKAGYFVPSEDLPVHPQEWHDNPDGEKKLKKAKNEYQKEMKRRIKDVNKVRESREKKRLERIGTIPSEIKEAEDKLNRLDQAQINFDEYKRLGEELKEMNEQIRELEEAVQIAERKEGQFQTAHKQAGVLERRDSKFFGKGAATKRKEAMEKVAESARYKFASHKKDLAKKQKRLEALDEDARLIRTEGHYKGSQEANRRIERLKAEAEELNRISFGHPVELGLS